MRGLIGLLLAVWVLAGCTSDPNAQVNQVPPIPQMDHFFNSLSNPSSAGPDYTHEPGYAPAYPPYDSTMAQ